MLAAYRTVRIPLRATPARYAAAHAPAGGVTVQGKRYTGGQFIPSEVMANATAEERAAVAQGEGRGKPLPPEGGAKLRDPAFRRPQLDPTPQDSPKQARPAPIAAVPRFDSPQAFAASLRDAYAAAGHDPETAAAVAARMPPEVVRRLDGRLASVVVHPTPDGVRDAFYDGDPELKSTPPARRQRCLGFYDGVTGALETDGGADPVGTLAHELSHAVDKVGPGAYLSDSDEWRYLWSRELRGGALSAYAATDPAEGFAEFGRLLWGSPTPEAAARFPGVSVFFQKHGLGGA